MKTLPLSALCDVNVRPSPPAKTFDRVYLQRDPQNLLDAAQSLIDRITYKPEWKLRLTAEAKSVNRPWQINVHLDYKVANLDGSYETVDLTTCTTFTERSLIEVLVSGDFVRYIAMNLIRRAELHEIDEWFKLDGVCVTDPHPEHRQMAQLRAMLAQDKEWFE